MTWKPVFVWWITPILFTLICEPFSNCEVHGFFVGNLSTNGPFLAVGETLELNCTTNGTDEEFIIQRGYVSLAQKYVHPLGNNGVRAVIRNVSFSDAGMYCCLQNVTLIACADPIAIGYPPQKPRLIRCVSDNFINMTCMWNTVGEEDLRIPTVSNVSYSVSPYTVSACPILMVEQLTMTCHWPERSVDTSSAFKPGFLYNICANTTNRLGSAISCIDINSSLKVKPSMVTHVTADVLNSSAVRLRWRVSFPIGLGNMIYSVIARKVGDQVAANLTNKVPIDNDFEWNVVQERVVGDLRPFTLYTFTIRVKPEKEGFWSDERQILRTTEEAAPDEGPSLTGSSFTDSPEDGQPRNVYLYWRPPDPSSTHGNVTGYEVTVANLDDSPNNQMIKGMSANVSERVLLLDIYHSYQIDIRSRNRVNLSRNAARLFLPRSSEVMDMTWEQKAERNDSHVTVSWQRIASDSQSITVHYCRGKVTRPNRIIANCEDNTYRWKSVDVSESSWSFSIDQPESYVFGISLETKTQRSGINWIDCVFQTGTGKVPGKIMDVEADSEEETIKITWTPLTCGQSAVSRVLHYEISYSSEAGQRCGNGTRLSFNGDFELTRASVTHLQSSTSYNVCIRAFSEAGPGPWSDAIAVTTKDKFPVLLTILSIFGSLLLIAVIVWVVRICRRYRSPLHIILPDSEIPNVDVYRSYGRDGYAEYTSIEQQHPVFTITDTVQDLLGNETLGMDHGLLRSATTTPADRALLQNGTLTSISANDQKLLKGTLAHTDENSRDSGLGQENISPEENFSTLCALTTYNGSLSDKNKSVDDPLSVVPKQTESVPLAESPGQTSSSYVSYSRFAEDGSSSMDSGRPMVHLAEGANRPTVTNQTNANQRHGCSREVPAPELTYIRHIEASNNGCSTDQTSNHHAASGASVISTDETPSRAAEFRASSSISDNVEDYSLFSSKSAHSSANNSAKGSQDPAHVRPMQTTAYVDHVNSRCISHPKLNNRESENSKNNENIADCSFTTDGEDDVDSLSYSKVHIFQEQEV